MTARFWPKISVADDLSPLIDAFRQTLGSIPASFEFPPLPARIADVSAKTKPRESVVEICVSATPDLLAWMAEAIRRHNLADAGAPTDPGPGVDFDPKVRTTAEAVSSVVDGLRLKPEAFAPAPVETTETFLYEGAVSTSGSRQIPRDSAWQPDETARPVGATRKAWDAIPTEDVERLASIKPGSMRISFATFAEANAFATAFRNFPKPTVRCDP